MWSLYQLLVSAADHNGENLMLTTIVRSNLMLDTFPSIWLEFKQNFGENLLISGFYCEWARGLDKSIEGQIARMKIFTKKIELASEKNKGETLLPLEMQT